MGTKHSKEIRNTKKDFKFQNEYSRIIYNNLVKKSEDIVNILIINGNMNANEEIMQLDSGKSSIKFILIDPISKELKFFFFNDII